MRRISFLLFNHPSVQTFVKVRLVRAAYELMLGRVVQDVRVDVNSQLSISNGILQLNFALPLRSSMKSSYKLR